MNFAKDPSPVYDLDLPTEGISLEDHGSYIRAQFLKVEVGLAIVGLALSILLFPIGLPALILLGPVLLMALFILSENRRDWQWLRYSALGVRQYLLLPEGVHFIGARSAVVAHKLERFVSPKRALELGRKPNILVDYGAFHLDIGMYLRHPLYRRLIVGVHRRRDYGYKDADYVDRVVETSFDDIDSMYENELSVADIEAAMSTAEEYWQVSEGLPETVSAPEAPLPDEAVSYKKTLYMLDEPWPGAAIDD